MTRSTQHIPGRMDHSLGRSLTLEILGAGTLDTLGAGTLDTLGALTLDTLGADTLDTLGILDSLVQQQTR